MSLVLTFSCSSGYSSSIRVPPHSGEDSMVTSSIFSSIAMALSPSGSIVVAFSAAPISPSGVRAALLSGFSTRFLSTFSLNFSVCTPVFSSYDPVPSPPQLHWRGSGPPAMVRVPLAVDELVPVLLGHSVREQVPEP